MRTTAILLLALTLGCTGQQGAWGTQSEGLKIVRFEPDLKEVQEEGKVVVALLAQNTGIFTARDVNANLFMHDSFEVTGAWDRNLADLIPANKELGTYGGTAEELWELKAPKIAKGEMTYPFDFLLDLAYDYESSGFRETPILQYSRVLQLKQENKPMPTGKETYNNGPLEISIKADDPIVLNSDNTFILRVILNLKSGYVKEKGAVGGDCGTEPLNCVRLVELELPADITPVPGLDADGDPNCVFDAAGQKAFVRLTEGKEAMLYCKLLVSRAADEYNPSIKVKATYRHHVRGEAPITVRK